MTSRAGSLKCCLLFATLLGCLGSADAAVKGTVRNATTGQPAVGVMLTLSTFQGGMTPVEEVTSGTDGTFEFTKDLPEVPPQQPFMGAIRAEFEAVGYTELLRRDMNLEDLGLVVYSASSRNLPKPDGRIVIFEPGPAEMVVNESYQFFNASNPPVTYSSEAGTLRFYLPPEAKGIVQVSGTGPAGMPLQNTGMPSGEENIYKVDFPLKPGENRVDVTYLIPREEDVPLEIHSIYRGVPTRVAAPTGVTISGEGVASVGQEPTTQAVIYDLPDVESVSLTVVGEGGLRRSSPAPAGGSGGGDISVQPAPVANEFYWIVGLTVLILGIGFYHLLTSTESSATTPSPKVPAAPPRPATGPSKKRRKA